MPSATSVSTSNLSLAAANMSQLIQRDLYQSTSNHLRSHLHLHQQQQQQQHQHQFHLPVQHATGSPQSQYQQFQAQVNQTTTLANSNNMQFPPPPPLVAPLVPQKSASDTTSINSFIVPQTQQQQQQQQISNYSLPQNNIHSQILIQNQPGTSGTSSKTQQQHQFLQQQLQQQQQQQQQQYQQLIAQANSHQVLVQGQQQQQPAQQQQQVPMTTIMIPASAASQIQSASVQIQQAASQAMAQNPGQGHILVFMIPYPVPESSASSSSNGTNGTNHQTIASPYSHYSQHSSQGQQSLVPPPPAASTPEYQDCSLNSTLIRQQSTTSTTDSLIREKAQHIQQQFLQTQPLINPNNLRAVSSLSLAATSSSHHNKEDQRTTFYIKTNFSYQSKNELELSFQRGDVLHVIDTLENSEHALQYWLATSVEFNGKEPVKGLIPDKNKAKQLAARELNNYLEGSDQTYQSTNGTDANDLNSHSIQFSNTDTLSSSNGSLTSNMLSAVSVGRVSFLKRRSAAQRSKSLCKDNWDNVVFDIGSFKLPIYERVVYRHPGFTRPVVIFGPLADLAREKLFKDYPEKYSYPAGFHHHTQQQLQQQQKQQQSSSSSIKDQNHPKVIRIKGIVEVIDQDKHALLDITPSAVEKLNHVNLAPIVIFMKTDSKSIIKEFRARATKSLDYHIEDTKSSSKLLEQSIKLEKSWYHVFTAVLNLSTMGSEMWYRKLRETIEDQQSSNVWMVANQYKLGSAFQVYSDINHDNLNGMHNNNHTNGNSSNNNNNNNNNYHNYYNEKKYINF